MKISSEILDTVSSTIERYMLIEPGEAVMIAFSGGKDSVGLTLCLSELGYAVHPIAIDMGYEDDWSSRIRALGKSMNFDVEIVNVRSAKSVPAPPAEYSKIKLRLDVLNSMGTDSRSGATPCTHCYNSKVIALDNAIRRHGVSKVAFGHHMTDACASLVKECLFRVDRVDRGHLNYSKANFESLVMELSEEAINYPAVPRPLTDRITELVCNNGSGTDEPPRQPLRTDREGTEIIRPLFGVWEECLTRLSEERAIRPEGSGCGHGATIGTQTPREMVHYRVLRNATPAFRKHLATLASVGLTETGHARMRSRYRRMDDLGPQYKSQLPMSDKL